MLFLLIAKFFACDLIVISFAFLLLVNIAGQPKSVRQTFLKERVLAADEVKARSRNQGRGARLQNFRLNLFTWTLADRV